MICTRCFKDDGLEAPLLQDLPMWAMADVAMNWKCTRCLNETEEAEEDQDDHDY